MTEDEIKKFELMRLIRKQVSDGLEQMRSDLDKAMFQPNPFYTNIKIKPVPYWKRKYDYLKWYFSNLWDAIRGIEKEYECND